MAQDFPKVCGNGADAGAGNEKKPYFGGRVVEGRHQPIQLGRYHQVFDQAGIWISFSADPIST